MAKQVTIPGGDDKGKTAEQLTDKALAWWAENAKFADVKDACNAEIERRAKGGKQAAAPAAKPAEKPSTALAQTGGTQLARNAVEGGYASASLADAKLREAAERFHLVSPATSCGSLPLGCEVALSIVHVNPRSDDVAKVGGGKVSLSGNVLEKIGAAAGVDWDPNLSRRLDNGRDPHYCHFRAVGYVKLFDGAVRTVTGEVEIDMREGSPQVIAMEQRAREGKNFASQLRDTRFFLIRHAETKAKLRAIADIGVKRSYTEAELEKPFAVARLMFTGRGIQNPKLEEMVAGKIADHMLGGSRALYGGAPQTQAPATLPSQPMPQQLHGHDAPALGEVPGDDSDYEAEGEAVRTPLPTGGQKPAESPGAAGNEDLAEEARNAGAY